MMDPDYKGQDYFANQKLRDHGPEANRRCSDLLFMLIFLGFIGVMGYITYGSYHDGNPKQLLNGVDGGGKVCGVDYPDYPYLLIFI